MIRRIYFGTLSKDQLLEFLLVAVVKVAVLELAFVRYSSKD